MKLFKKGLKVVLIVFIIAQFFGPDKNEGNFALSQDFINDTNPPEHVKQILITSCFDCHSDFTRYPWYNAITPINYWLDNHIDHGKKHFNISKWNTYSVKKKDHKFEELIEMVEKKEMPLPSYTWTHTNANLTNSQIKDMIDWAKSVRLKYSLLPKPE